MASDSQSLSDYPKLDANFFAQNGVDLRRAVPYANLWNRAVDVRNEKANLDAPADKLIRQLYEVGQASGTMSYLLLEGFPAANPQDQFRTDAWQKGVALQVELDQKANALVRAIGHRLATDSPVSDLWRRVKSVQSALMQRSPGGPGQMIQPLRELFDAGDEGALRFLSRAAKATIESLPGGKRAFGVSQDPLVNLGRIRQHQQEDPGKFHCGLEVPVLRWRIGGC